jgi:hypothetical protein
MWLSESWADGAWPNTGAAPASELDQIIAA